LKVKKKIRKYIRRNYAIKVKTNYQKYSKNISTNRPLLLKMKVAKTLNIFGLENRKRYASKLLKIIITYSSACISFFATNRKGIIVYRTPESLASRPN
jgi:hypothetical protein